MVLEHIQKLRLQTQNVCAPEWLG